MITFMIIWLISLNNASSIQRKSSYIYIYIYIYNINICIAKMYIVTTVENDILENNVPVTYFPYPH